MKKATKSWHERTFDQHISKEKVGPAKKKNLSKLEEILLSDLNWIREPGSNYIWVCLDPHTSIKDQVFYVITHGNSDQCFCSLPTWTSYKARNYSYKVDNSRYNEFYALYKILTMIYYDEV